MRKYTIFQVFRLLVKVFKNENLTIESNVTGLINILDAVNKIDKK